MSSYLALFDTTRHSDPKKIFDLLNSISRTPVWNFLPGVFAIDTDRSKSELNKLFKEDFESYLIVEFLPTQIDGRLPSEGWDAWVFTSFFDRFVEQSKHVGADPEVFERAREAYFKRVEEKKDKAVLSMSRSDVD